MRGTSVEMRLRTPRWCCHSVCFPRRTFSSQSAPVVAAYARDGSGSRVRSGLSAMPRDGVRLSDCSAALGFRRAMTASCAISSDMPPLFLMAHPGGWIDDWSWRCGTRCGTVVVDLERRAVVNVLSDRSQTTMAAWLRGHPSVEVVSRDRCRLYAQAARQGALQARQIADGFHLVQNLRLAIERQLSRAPRVSKSKNPPRPDAPHPPSPHQEHQDPGRRLVWLTRLLGEKRPQQERRSLAAIVTASGLNWRTVAKWTLCDTLPIRRRMDPCPRNPVRFTA